MGTNTDPYQKAEGKYHLTQGIVRVLAEAANPFSILTKSTLVLRDLALLEEAATRTSVSLALSIGTLDREVWRLTEPGTPPPDKRLEAVAKLNEAGVRCGVLIAPVLPGLSDSEDQLRAVTKACLAAGAVSVTPVALHLRPGVREHYLESAQPRPPRVVGTLRRAIQPRLLSGQGRPGTYLRDRQIRRSPKPAAYKLAPWRAEGASGYRRSRQEPQTCRGAPAPTIWRAAPPGLSREP